MPTPPQLTRELLEDDRFIDRLRAEVVRGNVRSQQELDASLDRMLAAQPAGDDVHVFAYGSLMWNPAIAVAGTAGACAHGWHRRFCLRSTVGRGSEQHPGLMLALDRGGCCQGTLLRIAAGQARRELGLLWRREMFTGAYEARWITASSGGRRVRAIGFVANRAHVRYVRGLAPPEMARMIATGRGSLGTCREYFDATLSALRGLGLRDAAMERLQREIVRVA